MIRDFFRDYKSLIYFLAQYKKLCFFLSVISIGYALFESINILVLLPLFESAMGNAASQGSVFKWLYKVIAFLPFKEPFFNALCLAIFILVIKELFAFGRLFAIAYGINKIVSETIERIFRKYVKSDYQFFIENKQGNLIYLIAESPYKLGHCLQSIPDLMTSIFMILTIGLLLISISVKMTFLLAVIGLFFTFFTGFLAKKVSFHIGNERVEIWSKAFVLLNEFFDGIKQMKLFSSFGLWQRNFFHAMRRFNTLTMKDAFWLAVPERLTHLFPLLILIGCAFYFKIFDQTFHNSVLEKLALGGIYLFGFYRLLPHVSAVGRLHMQIIKEIPDLNKLTAFLDKQTISIIEGSGEIDRFEKEIKFEEVSFGYKEGLNILDQVNFTIKKGQKVAIVGVSGAGKSTLVNLLLKLFLPKSGRILMDGIDIADLKTGSLTKLISLVSQETFIFNGTVRENILFGLRGIADDQFENAVQQAHVTQFIENLSDGYDSMVGEKGFKLSGGQRQRIAIARALLRNPHIIILDEATNSLDTRSEMFIQEAIKNLTQKRTLIIITHRLTSIQKVDKVFLLDKGKIVSEEVPIELLQSGRSDFNCGCFRC